MGLKEARKNFLIYLFMFVTIIILISTYTIFFDNSIKTCGDGTENGKCSITPPYFCSNGTLITKASVCKCLENFYIQGNSCVSEYQEKPKEVKLSYVLRGEKKSINFTAYEDFVDYLSETPRTVGSISKGISRKDFKIEVLNNKEQREMLLPLVVEIQNLAKEKEEQIRIAVSLVQNIPFGNSEKKPTNVLEGVYLRTPYEVLYDNEGICEEKADLLVFILRELGFGTAYFYYPAENHEAVGIKCAVDESLDKSGFCFIETTLPSIITDNKGEFFGLNGQLTSTPQVFNISDGISLGNNLYEYSDAETMINIRETMIRNGQINFFQNRKYQELKEKYGLTEPEEYVF